MIRDDTLWKCILEGMIVYFLKFFFEEADQLLDLSKKVVFLDKEMAQISKEEEQKPSKYVDKLVKVFTKEGEEKWVLIHIEVQGYRDKKFEERMYVYNYRIFDLYHVRIAAIVILSDKFKRYRPAQYYSKFLGTETLFKFKTYKILDQDEATLSRSKNPFAFVILAVLLALKKRKNLKTNNEEDLLRMKIVLVKTLLDQKFSKPVIRSLFYFIRNYVVFEKEENNRKFNSIIYSTTDKNKTMSIVEVIRERQKKAILEAGVEIGIEKGKAQGKAEAVTNLLNANQFTISEIANFAGVTEAFVRKIKKSLK